MNLITELVSSNNIFVSSPTKKFVQLVNVRYFARVSPCVENREKKNLTKIQSEITLQISENTDNVSFDNAMVFQTWYRVCRALRAFLPERIVADRKTYRGNSINGVLKYRTKIAGTRLRRAPWWNFRDECYSASIPFEPPPPPSRSVFLSVNYAQLISPGNVVVGSARANPRRRKRPTVGEIE